MTLPSDPVLTLPSDPALVQARCECLLSSCDFRSRPLGSLAGRVGVRTPVWAAGRLSRAGQHTRVLLSEDLCPHECAHSSHTRASVNTARLQLGERQAVTLCLKAKMWQMEM